MNLDKLKELEEARYALGWIRRQVQGVAMKRLRSISRAIEEVCIERGRQLDKWGVQSHPSVPAEYAETPQARQTFQAIAAELERAAKADCDFAFRRGKGTWYHIAWEELAEVGAAPPEKQREELVQLTAVCLAWLEDLDAKTKARALLELDTPTEDSKP